MFTEDILLQGELFMKSNNQTKGMFIFHPVLFGLYAVLALYVFNREETVISAMWLALITSLIVTIVVIAGSLLLFRSWQKAAAAASLTLMLFYAYGHVYNLTQDVKLLGQILGRDRSLIPIWILLFIAGQLLLARSGKTAINKALNWISLFLTTFVLVQILISQVQFGIMSADSPDKNVSAQDIIVPGATDRDVYYIIVDAYSRQDLLQKRLNLDTSEFISGLQNLGFYIPDCAQSNYDTTLRSMTSTLNMNYLEALHLDYGDDNLRYGPYIQKNVVMEQFKKRGYSIATFNSLYRMLDMPDTTYYYDYFKDASTLNRQAAVNFQYLFLKTTFVRPLIGHLERHKEINLPSYLDRWIPTANASNSREYRQYHQNVFALDSLQKIPNLPGRKFVYAHLYITHQPYVFHPDGSFNPFVQQGENGYRDQVIYASSRLLEIVESILANSDPAPIIVIQSDHSNSEYADRVKILNAYYLPDGGNDMLYDTITPVNTFRVIFNVYFGGKYELLPDISRYADKNKVLQTAPSTCVSRKPVQQ